MAFVVVGGPPLSSEMASLIAVVRPGQCRCLQRACARGIERRNRQPVARIVVGESDELVARQNASRVGSACSSSRSQAL